MRCLSAVQGCPTPTPPTNVTRRGRTVRAALVATAILASAAMPALATDPAPRAGDPETLNRQLDEMKKTFDQFWGDVMETMEPTLERLVRTFEALERIDDLKHYEDPEVLENGDIIMRRREDAPPLPPPGVDPEEGVDL